MECIKTGCDVYIPAMGAVVHGDLFKHDGVYILNAKGCLDHAKYDTTQGHIRFDRSAVVGNSEVIICNKLDASQFYDCVVDLSDA